MIKKLFAIFIFSMMFFAMSVEHSYPLPAETNRDIVYRIAGKDLYHLVCAIISVESGWDANVISNTQDYGLMQINYHVWKSHYDWERILEPEYNINAGVSILKLCLEARGNDVRKALIYYNGSSSYPDKVFKQLNTTS